MIHRLLFSTLGLMTLAMCQSQKVSETKKLEETTAVSPVKTTPVKNTNNNGEPEMSVGLPPDEEAEKTAKDEQSQSAMMYLKEGETQMMKAEKMKVTFTTMKEDSRCPQDVNCVWAGVATAEIQLLGASKRPLTILLSTMNDPNRGHQQTVNFEGYNYTLVEVSPETTSDKGFKSNLGNYKIALKIEKGESENTILQR